MQKFLTFFITIAIIYMLAKEQFNFDSKDTNGNNKQIESIKETQDSQKENINLEGGFFEKTISTILSNVLKTKEGRLFFENIIQPINKSVSDNEGFKINNLSLLSNIFKLETSGDGKIGPALCGHKVSISYKLFDLNNNNIPIKEGKETVTLGAKSDIKILNAILFGMKTNQIRTATLPSKYSDNSDQRKMHKIVIKLDDISSNYFINTEEIKIFDDQVAYQIPLVCGDITKFHAKITKLGNGEILYNSKTNNYKIKMQIGDLSYPMIFAHALYGKIPIGSRVVITQGKYYNPAGVHGQNKLNNVKLDENEYFMLEISDIDVEFSSLSSS